MAVRGLLFTAVLAAAISAACGCAHSYTHSRGLLEAPTCHYNHALAGRDWPAEDSACNWTCSGSRQSPINVPTYPKFPSTKLLAAALKASTAFGVAANPRVLNLGHVVQVEFDSPVNNTASVVYFGDSIYTMYDASNPNALAHAHRVHVEPLQFHFHSTSEHLLRGRSAQLELHIVTKLVQTPGVPMPKECPANGDKPCLAVFGVMFDIGTNPYITHGDATVQKILDFLPEDCETVGRTCVKNVTGWTVDLGALLPATDYYTYSGSLTTPPCTEGVMWHVFPTVKATLTQRQLISLQDTLSAGKNEGAEQLNRMNNRETQRINGRHIFYAHK